MFPYHHNECDQLPSIVVIVTHSQNLLDLLMGILEFEKHVTSRFGVSVAPNPNVMSQEGSVSQVGTRCHSTKTISFLSNFG